jgi:hypothetical protein
MNTTTREDCYSMINLMASSPNDATSDGLACGVVAPRSKRRKAAS